MLRRIGLGLAVATALPAQTIRARDSLHTTAARAVIDGVVSDTNLVPLQAAFVSMLGTDIITRRQTKDATSKFIQWHLGLTDEKPETRSRAVWSVTLRAPTPL